MKNRVPSPALVVSIIALVVACTATAYAATVITNSGQIRRGVVNGTDIKNRSIRGGDIAKNTIQTGNLSKSLQTRVAGGSGGTTTDVTELIRKSGPENQAANQNIRVAQMSVPSAGAYVITAKITQQAFPPTGLLAGNGPVYGHCRLDAAGVADDSYETIAAQQLSAAGQHHMQMTRTLGAGSVIQVICDSGIVWRGSNTSIIAMKVGSVRATNVGP
jgi:hypothetical protein